MRDDAEQKEERTKTLFRRDFSTIRTVCSKGLGKFNINFTNSGFEDRTQHVHHMVRFEAEGLQPGEHAVIDDLFRKQAQNEAGHG